MNLDSARERYWNDPEFHALVDTMASWYERLQFTPSEMREAAVFAALLVEQRMMRPTLFPTP